MGVLFQRTVLLLNIWYVVVTAWAVRWVTFQTLLFNVSSQHTSACRNGNHILRSLKSKMKMNLNYRSFTDLSALQAEEYG